MSLIESWLRVARARGLSPLAALSALSEQTGQRYPTNYLYRWRHGRRRIPAEAQRAMMRDSLRLVIAQEILPAMSIDPEFVTHLDDEALDRIAEMLSP